MCVRKGAISPALMDGLRYISESTSFLTAATMFTHTMDRISATAAAIDCSELKIFLERVHEIIHVANDVIGSGTDRKIRSKEQQLMHG